MIETTDLTCNLANVIDSFTIDWGSDMYPDMIQPVTCNMTVLGWTAGYDVMQAVGQEIWLRWQGWNLFTGMIRAINVQDEGNGTYLININAVSRWDSFGLKNIGGNGYPAQTDAQRIDQLIAEAGAYAWQDISPAIDWATMTTAWYSLTWANWASTVDQLDGFSTGGTTYNFDATAGSDQSALTWLADTSADSRGRFYAPWSNGYLYWKSYTDVQTLLAAPNFTIAGATEIIDGSLSAIGSTSDIYNVVNLTAADGSITGAADTTSISTFGIRPLDINTNIEAASRQTIADSILATAAGVRSNLTGFRIQTTSWDLTRGQNFLIYCISGSIGAATVTGIPTLFGGPQNVLITGGTMIYSGSDTVFDIKCQTANEISAVQTWQQVDVSYTWATYLPNSIWSEAA